MFFYVPAWADTGIAAAYKEREPDMDTSQARTFDGQWQLEGLYKTRERRLGN
jgi:hypothetical protein